MGLSITGTLTKIESKAWKKRKPDDPDRETVTLFVTEHGYAERVELSTTLDKDYAESFVGKVISGPVRVFRRYDEAVKRVNTRIVLMEIGAEDAPVAA